MSTLLDAVHEPLKSDHFYITREVQNFAQSTSKDRFAMNGILLDPKEQSMVATDGHVLAVRPFPYRYEGPPTVIEISGKLLTTKEYVVVPPEVLDSLEETTLRVLPHKEGNPKVVTLKMYDHKEYPDVWGLVRAAKAEATAHHVGIDLKLLMKVIKSMGTAHVKLSMSGDEMKPLVVYYRDDDDQAAAITGVIMPRRIN